MNATYATSDLYLSAFLVSSGIPLDSFARDNGRTTFRFEQRETLPQLVTNFYADKANVSPMKYGNSLKNLKALIYSKDTNTYENNYVSQQRKSN